MSPSITPSKLLPSLRETLMSLQKAHHINNSGLQENQEGIDVYANVETLLEALRMERLQEKLRADEEIKQLKEKLALYESSTFNKPCDPLSNLSGANNELAECLLETLALLEEECAEWQNTRKDRQLLDNITNHLSPSPKKQQTGSFSTKKATPPQKTPTQKLVRSIQRLKAIQSNTQAASYAKEAKSLASHFDKEIKADQNFEDALVGLHLLDKSDNSDVLLGSTSTLAEGPTVSAELTPFVPSLEDLEDDVYGLRQQLWNEMVEHVKRVAQLQHDINATSIENEKLKFTVKSANAEFNRVTSEMLKAFYQKKSLDAVVSTNSDVIQQHQLNLAKMSQELESLQDSSRAKADEKERILVRAKMDMVIMQARMMWAVAKCKFGNELRRSPRELELLEQIAAQEVKMHDIERKCLDAQMRAGIEQNARLSMSIKLETAMARLDEQSTIILSLQQQLKDSKTMTRAYSSQVEYLSDELQRAQLEARESLEDMNQSMRRYRSDAVLLRGDLNVSFGTIP